MKAGLIPTTQHDRGSAEPREGLRIKVIVQRNWRCRCNQCCTSPVTAYRRMSLPTRVVCLYCAAPEIR